MACVLATFIGGFAVVVVMAMVHMDLDAALPQAITKGIALLCAVSAVYSLWMYVTLRIYRCPTCGAKTATVDEAYPEIHKFCAACGVEWITGLAHSQSLD